VNLDNGLFDSLDDRVKSGTELKLAFAEVFVLRVRLAVSEKRNGLLLRDLEGVVDGQVQNVSCTWDPTDAEVPCNRWLLLRGAALD